MTARATYQMQENSGAVSADKNWLAGHIPGARSIFVLTRVESLGRDGTHKRAPSTGRLGVADKFRRLAACDGSLRVSRVFSKSVKHVRQKAEHARDNRGVAESERYRRSTPRNPHHRLRPATTYRVRYFGSSE